MRIDRLQIPAFGPFTDLDLAFNGEPADFHVIYGPNEAGKSSLLRAIRDLLFGIPGQSADNFQHDYGDLRIQAQISNRAGERLVFARRKGNKNTLLDGENNPLPDKTLAVFLGGIDQEYFTSMFGLGAAELREGAAHLLRGEGDIGQALFSASLGGRPVQQVLERLRDRSEQLYKPRATVNVTIRPAVVRYKELLKQSREAMVNPEMWETLEKELVEAQRQQRGLEDKLSQLDEELAQIDRWEAALPIVVRFNDALRQLNELPAVPPLAAGFVSRAQAARSAVQKEQGEVQRLTEGLGQLEKQLEAVPEGPHLLGRADALNQLHEDLGAYKSDVASFDRDKARIAGLERALRTGMGRLELAGEIESLGAARLSSPARLACEAAAKALSAAEAERTKIAQKIRDLKDHIQEQQDELPAVADEDLAPLREALTAAEGAIEADRSYGLAEAELRTLSRKTAALHKQLEGVPKDFQAAADLPVPAVATLRQFQERFAEFKRELQVQMNKLQEGSDLRANLQADLARIQRQRALPTEDDLREARQRRDYGWTLVLANWKGAGNNEVLDPALPLEEAFPKTIRHADDVVDVLREQAEAVAQAEEKRLRLAEADRQRNDVEQKLNALAAAQEKSQSDWKAQWTPCAIEPRSPAEMIEWRETWCVFKELLSQRQALQESLEAKHLQIQRAVERLATALGESEKKEFVLLFQQAKARVQEAEQRSGRCHEISKQLNRSRTELAKLDEKLTLLLESAQTAGEQWRTQCLAVRLPEGIAPEGGLELLRERAELLAQFDQWQELSENLRLTSARIQDYEQAVRKNADALGITGASTLVLEAAIWKALNEAREAHVARSRLTEQIGQVQRDLADARSRFSRTECALGEVVSLAQLSNATELEGFLSRLEKRNRLQEQMSELRGSLVGLARSPEVDEFIGQACQHSPEELRESKARLGWERAEATSKLDPVRKAVFGLADQKQKLEKAGDAAANFRQQAESWAARIREDSTRYLRLRVAIQLLETQIKRFREQNQAPLLRRSGQLFRQITRGAFVGLSADVNAGDVPVLVALRSPESKVPVEGLSDGTRDQLYLALRLAALERHLQEHETMPLILDDLLITFDNARAAAILPPLAELAHRTQVFLFTHHRHLVELCRENLDQGRYHLHELGVTD